MSAMGRQERLTPRAAARKRRRPRGEKYILRLYVTGATMRSVRAIANVKRICEEHLKGRYELQIVDLYQQPQLAKGEQIFAVPALIRRLPPPLRQIIGDMSETESVLTGLDLRRAA